MQEPSGTQYNMTYIEQQQATVAQWVVLRPLFELCTRERRYKVRGRRRKALWLQEATEKQLWATLAGSREANRTRRSGEEMDM